ncbi:MAG TPA: tetratricopeptide repeat protein, partial [Saprospiraceae bacterium]|nr:tetratricopeptide repeat protein [Saprospiraceae bacterium]
KNEALGQSVEFMKFEFDSQTPTSAILALSWEKRRIPIKIEVDGLKLQFESFKRELETPKGFTSVALSQAANFCLQNNYELEQGFSWANRAAGTVFPGERNFNTLNTLANFLVKQGKQTEADAIMKEAIPLGNAIQVNTYARTLITQKRAAEAMSIYKANYDKYPNTFASNFGMMRAHSAVGEYKKAIDFAKKALGQAPSDTQKLQVDKMIKDLELEKDIN